METQPRAFTVLEGRRPPCPAHRPLRGDRAYRAQPRDEKGTQPSHPLLNPSPEEVKSASRHWGEGLNFRKV